jgi:hypothetical protein
MKYFDRISAQAKTGVTMMAGALLMSVIASPASAETVRWRSIKGSSPFANVNGAVQPNAVDAIPPGGRPWTTLGGRAKVNLATSQVNFEVEGLVLLGGNTIGTPGAVNKVVGSVVCNPGLATQQIRDTPAVTLSPQGDAEFSGATTAPLPSTCNSTNIAFLVRIGPVAGAWIAAGVVKSSSTDE